MFQCRFRRFTSSTLQPKILSEIGILLRRENAKESSQFLIAHCNSSENNSFILTTILPHIIHLIETPHGSRLLITLIRNGSDSDISRLICRTQTYLPLISTSKIGSLVVNSLVKRLSSPEHFSLLGSNITSHLDDYLSRHPSRSYGDFVVYDFIQRIKDPWDLFKDVHCFDTITAEPRNSKVLLALLKSKGVPSSFLTDLATHFGVLVRYRKGAQVCLELLERKEVRESVLGKALGSAEFFVEREMRDFFERVDDLCDEERRGEFRRRVVEAVMKKPVLGRMDKYFLNKCLEKGSEQRVAGILCERMEEFCGMVYFRNVLENILTRMSSAMAREVVDGILARAERLIEVKGGKALLWWMEKSAPEFVRTMVKEGRSRSVVMDKVFDSLGER